MDHEVSIFVSINEPNELTKVKFEISQIAINNGIQLKRTEPEKKGHDFFELDSVISMVSTGTVTVGLNILASAIFEKIRKRSKNEQAIQKIETEEEIKIIDKSSGLKIIIKSRKTTSLS